jgi:multidrug efflux pump subunit AcrA (membrane-fusion protein)
MHSENRRTDAVDKVLIFIRQYRHYYGNRRLWYVIAPVAVLALAASLMTFGEEEKTGSWTPVRFGTFEVDLTESGDIRAVNSYNIDAPMEWRVDLQITDMVPEGTIVKEGDFLVQFDTSALEEDLVTALDQLKAQEAELLSVQTKQQSQLSQYDSDLKIAEYSRESSQLQLDLLKFESEVRKEDARLSYQKALISFDETTTKIKNQKIINEAEMNQVLHILDYRRKRVKDMKQRLENLTLRAPIGGMVV